LEDYFPGEAQTGVIEFSCNSNEVVEVIFTNIEAHERYEAEFLTESLEEMKKNDAMFRLSLENENDKCR